MRMSPPELDNELQQLHSHVAALEQLLDVHESTVAKQSDRLEQARLMAEQRLDQLRESEERFKVLVDHAPEAIMLLDVDQGHFVHANENALRLFGLSRNQLLKLTPDQISPKIQPDGRSSVESAREKIDAVLGGEKRIFEWIHCNSAGVTVPCEVRLVRLPGQKKLVRASITDITARKQIERSLSRARDTAEAASRAKSDLLANMSREIRTPLNSIIGRTELVLQSGLSDAQREHLEIVKESGDRLLAMINGVLDFSAIEASKLELFPVAFDLRALLRRAVKPLTRRAAEKSVELRMQVAESVPDRLTGDCDRLKQVLVNLLGNAIKFTDKGRILLKVTLKSRSNKRAVLRFTVIDSGLGIPKEKLAHVFDAFEQADNSMIQRHAGIGLGLALSSRLVELLGGQLKVESELGIGSKFQFTANFQLQQQPSHEPRVNVRSSDVPSPIESVKILLVEDSQMDVKLFVVLALRWGYQVTVARNGCEAVALFEQQEFDLVLMDIQMPGLDGLQATAAIREMVSRSGRHIPIIALSAHDMPADRQRCLSAGMDGHVTKPISQRRLRQAVESVRVSNGVRG